MHALLKNMASLSHIISSMHGLLKIFQSLIQIIAVLSVMSRIKEAEKRKLYSPH